MNIQTRSTRTFFILLVILAVMAGLNSILPQGDFAAKIPTTPIPVWQLALAAVGSVIVIYGLLGYLGLRLWRALGFPEIWEEAVTNRQRFLIPAIVGAAMGVFLIVGDLVFSPINGIGRLIHPPFPTSLVATISAGIGEEMIFRLFFISFWTWLVGKIILRGRGLTAVYWVVACLSAAVFAAGHIPSLMAMLGITDVAQFAPALIGEIFLLNGAVSIACAYLYKKYGFLTAVGVHFWADIVWHVLWSLV